MMLPINFYIEGRDLKDVWYKGLKLIIDKGSPLSDERHSVVWEVLNLTAYIKYTHGNPPEEVRSSLLKEYQNTLLNDENKGFSYTYGERLNNWNGYNQIEGVMERIKKFRKTRRAVAVTYIPDKDGKSSEIPCLIAVDFKLREKLFLTAYFRSNDFYGAFPYNVAALSYLQDYIANEVKADTGGITIFSTSSHLYTYDVDNVKEILKKRRFQHVESL